jgi:hypothetical protein
MIGTTARHRIIFSMVIIAESVVLTVVVPRLVTLARLTAGFVGAFVGR